MSKWQVVGEVCVDSGTVMVTDPCYIDSEWRKANKKPGSFGFDGILGALLAEPSDGGQPKNTAQVCFKSGYEGAAVVVTRFGGDGTYPVEAKILDNGEIAAIRVVFRRT
jgi:hypothetical protein